MILQILPILPSRMATQSQGIQQLLAAERRAAEKVGMWHGMLEVMKEVMVAWCHVE